VLGGHGDDHTWTQDDFASAVLVLDALGTPDQLVNDWRVAGSRIQRQATLSEKREKRVRFRKDFRKGIPVILLSIVLCLGTGIAITYLGRAPAPGTGNWAAFVISCLIFLAVIFIISFLASDEMYNSSNADDRFIQVLWACGIASLVLGLLSHHIEIGNSSHIMRRVGLDIRNWLIWRF